MDSLPEQVQENMLQLAEQSTEREIVSVLAAPPPRGMDMNISRSGFREWRRRKLQEKALAQAKEFLETAGDGKDLDEATLGVLRERLFAEADRERLDARHLMDLYKVAQQSVWKQRQFQAAKEKAALAREYLELARERIRLNAAKVALEHGGELRGLIGDGAGGEVTNLPARVLEKGRRGRKREK